MASLRLYSGSSAITPCGRRPRQQPPVLSASDGAIPALKRHLAQQRVGRLDRISLEQLVRFLGRVGGSIELQVRRSSRHSVLYALQKQRE
jgi:hypothetical protein